MTEHEHRHECRFCGWVWRHPDSFDAAHGSKGYHECFRCGRCNWGMGIYEGEKQPPETSQRDTPGRMDHDFTCGLVDAIPHPDPERARQGLTVLRAVLCGTYREVMLLGGDCGSGGDGVAFEKGKRYRIIIQELPPDTWQPKAEGVQRSCPDHDSVDGRPCELPAGHPGTHQFPRSPFPSQ